MPIGLRHNYFYVEHKDMLVKIQVLRLLAEGQTGREIAQGLGIALKTAQTYADNLMRKMGIHSQALLVKYAIDKDIIDLEVNK